MKKGYLILPKRAARYSSRRFPQHPFANVAYLEDGKTADPKETGEAILKELGTIKSALEKELTKKFEDQQKHADVKLETVTKALADVEAKLKVAETTAADLKALQDDCAIDFKALDKVQLAMKHISMSKGTTPEVETVQGLIAKALESKKAEIKSGELVGKSMKDQGMQMKAVNTMTVIGNVSSGVVPNTYRSGIIPLPYENVHLRDIVNVTPSETDSYHFFRHANTGEGAITWQGNEFGTKAQFDEDLTEVTVNLDYLAGFLKISRKMLRNFTGLQAMLTRWLPEKYYQAEDIKGHQAIIALATGVANTDTGGGMIRQIIRTIGNQRKARYSVNGIVLDGAAWANILTFTASGSGEFTMPIGVVTISATGQLMICGIPVYVASWVATDEAIIADWRMFEIIQSEGLQLGFFEQDGTNVQQNLITVRIEASIGFAMLDPKAFAVASLASVS